MKVSFEWDEKNNQQNILKHKISFNEAQKVFLDKNRLVFEDVCHSSSKEVRYYCLGKINDKVCTVRFTYRNKLIRIFGAGYWRKEQKIYEKINR